LLYTLVLFAGGIELLATQHGLYSELKGRDFPTIRKFSVSALRLKISFLQVAMLDQALKRRGAR
jgi:hypothetical protein